MTIRTLTAVTVAVVVGLLFGGNVAQADAYLSKQSARARALPAVIFKAWDEGAEEYSLERAGRCSHRSANVVQCEYTMYFVPDFPKFDDVYVNTDALREAIQNSCHLFKGVIRVKRHPLDGYLTVSFPREDRCATRSR